MKKILLVLLTTFSLSTYAAVYPAGTYYIGGKDDAFKSIQAAFDSLYENGIAGSVTLKIRTGIYLENFAIKDIKRNSILDEIILESESGNNSDVIIQYNAEGDADNYIVKLDSTLGITVQNISFLTKGTRYYQQVCLHKSTAIKFIGNNFMAATIGNIDQSSTCLVGTDGLGYNDNITFDKNNFYGGYIAISISGGYNGEYDTNISISNNSFKNTTNASVYAYMTNNMDVHHNTITGGSDYYALSFNEVVANKGLNIYNNYIGSGSISLQYCNSGTVRTNNIKIYNNRVTTKGNALDIMSSSGIYAFHNSLLATDYSEGSYLITLNSDSAIFFRNNFCISLSNPYYSLGNNQDLSIQNNAYWWTQISFCPNLEISTFSDWQKNTNYDTNGVEVEKISFIDDDMTTLRLASAQDTLKSIFNSNEIFPVDCDNQTRSKNPYYGADEYVYEGSPVAFLKGTVFFGKDTVKAGKVILYADVTNNKIFDIVDEQDIDIYGHYQMENFIQRNYILKVIPSETMYPDLIPTYNGFEMAWEKAQFFKPDSGKYTLVDLYVIQMDKMSTDVGSISGYVYSDGSFKTNDPIPGLDIILDKIPPSTSVKMTKTDANGYYEFHNLPMGNFKVNVDLPGIGVSSIHQVDITNQNPDQNHLDYCVDNSVNICANSTKQTVNIVRKTAVYPNPFSSSISITLPDNFISAQISIYDVLGKEVLTQKISVSDNTFILSTDDLSKGAYVLQLNIDGEIVNQKMMKQ
ncbi:MAG: T9SS type A sorting domain-containing protein [Bacteroidetes bacterium]|nr:T9SS type A sorting domain-containing protein [Bacteroidota bacterium]